MLEYLIQPTEAEWFNLSYKQFAEALKPTTFSSKPVQGWGDHRSEVEGVTISFSMEDPGIQVCFEEDISEVRAYQIVNEILQNVARVSGQKGKVIGL
jgi:hypothetical protein